MNALIWIAGLALFVGGLSALRGLPGFLNLSTNDSSHMGKFRVIRMLRWVLAILLVIGLIVLVAVFFKIALNK